jgi:hypothetical protein
LADQLARATLDCPLITVGGGRLLATKAIEPAMLQTDKEFQYAVLDRFEQEMVGNVGVDDPDLCRRFLAVISATVPIR